MCDTNVIIIGTIPTYQGGYQVSPAGYPAGLTQQPIPSPPTYGNPTYNNNTYGYYHQPQPPQVVPPMTGDYPLPEPHQVYVTYVNLFNGSHSYPFLCALSLSLLHRLELSLYHHNHQ